MRFYLARWTGDGSLHNEFVADVDALWAATDLRVDVSRREGWALVATPGRATVRGGVDLGDDLDGSSPAMRRGVESALGVTLAADTLRGAIAELLIVHGESDLPGRTRWKRLRVNRSGRHLIRYRPPGSPAVVVYDAPAPLNTVVTESFDKADSDTLGPDLTWTELGTSDWDVASNRAQIGTAGASSLGAHYARADSDLASSDNYAQFSLLALHSPDHINNATPMCRYSPTAATGYGFKRRSPTTGDADYRLERIDAGSVTALTSFATQALAVPETLKVDADGSAIAGYIDGVEKATATDSNITTGVRGGIGGFLGVGGTAGEVQIDSFEAGDLGAAEITGSGSGQLAAINGSGAGTVEVSGSGTGQLPAVTGSGTGTTEVSGSGTGTLPTIEGSGTGAVEVTGTGTGTLPAFEGSGTVTITGDTFWSRNAVGFAKSAVGYTKVGSDDQSPW